MVKLVYCVHRSPGMSQEEFRRYWYEDHGPLVKSFAEALRAHRYVQNHLLDTPLNDVAREPRGTMEPYDGVTEVWFADHDELAVAMQTPEAQEAHRTLIEDEARFCDLSRSTLFLTEEKLIFEA